MHASEFIDLPPSDAVIAASYEQCIRTAQALQDYLRAENELLFAGLGGHLLSDAASYAHKSALLAAYSDATDVLATAINEGRIGSASQINRTLQAAYGLRTCLHTNNFLLAQEEAKHKQRIDSIMRRVALADLNELVDVHGELPTHLLSDGLYVTH